MVVVLIAAERQLRIDYARWKEVQQFAIRSYRGVLGGGCC
jgi:hypothetical protein